MRSFQTARDRWAGLGPYYAMFPVPFADRVIKRYSRPGDVVLDPFAGRGTAVYSAAVQGRCGIGIEINPVGWVYTKTKLAPASMQQVCARLAELGGRTSRYGDAAARLPSFFQHCFSREVRRFLIAARSELDWKHSRIDRTVMATVLVYLHGKAGQALSNQMRQTKAMSPDYAIRWWVERALTPPRIDPVEFLQHRLAWRYAKGLPQCNDGSRAYLGDSATILRRLEVAKRPRLLFTSPPYYQVTNYHYDQWLRLWMLGEAPNALRKPGIHRHKFEGQAGYQTLLNEVFAQASELMSSSAVIYVRTGRGRVTKGATEAALLSAFPGHRLTERRRPFKRPTQTHLFGDHSKKVGEVDLILVPSERPGRQRRHLGWE